MKMGRIDYYPMGPNIDLSVLNNNEDWSEFYGGVEEELPPKITGSRGRAINIYSFVDDNHAVNSVSRRSYTEIIMFIQNTSIIWFSKRRNTVKAATFVRQLVVLRICKDLVVALRYKLRVFGVKWRK